eukprot:Partr_v1_DN26054_c0_g1_i2_m228 putative NUF2, NDC80 kinetochore complex component, homolog (S. cerevisiae)
MPPQKSYYPLMRVADIVQCLDALDIKISEAEILKPQPNSVLRLFETLADILMNIQYGRFTGQLGDEGALDRILEDTTDYPELHRDSLSTMMFFRQFSRVMLNIGVRSFCLRDLTHPEPARIRSLLSAIINFARFREERLALFEELTAQTDELVKEKMLLVENRDSMTEQINSIKLQRNEEQPRVDKLVAVTRDMAEKLKEMKSTGDQINSGLSVLKAEKSVLVDRKQNTDISLQVGKQEVERLRSRIVRNPEQLKKAIQDMNSSFQALKQAVAQSEKQSFEIKLKIENLATVEQDLASCVKLQEECELEMKVLNDIKKKVYAKKDLSSRKQAEYRELEIKEQQLKRQETASEEKLNRLHNQLAVKHDSTSSKLRKYRQEWEELSGDDQEAQKQIEDFGSQITVLKSKLQELKTAGEMDLSSAQNDISIVKNIMNSCLTDMKYAMAEVDQIVL